MLQYCGSGSITIVSEVYYSITTVLTSGSSANSVCRWLLELKDLFDTFRCWKW